MRRSSSLVRPVDRRKGSSRRSVGSRSNRFTPCRSKCFPPPLSRMLHMLRCVNPYNAASLSTYPLNGSSGNGVGCTGRVMRPCPIGAG